MGGVRTAIFAQSVTGWTAFNQEQHDHGDPRVSWWSYVGSSDFWQATFQNWQSEFLAVGAPISDATGQEG